MSDFLMGAIVVLLILNLGLLVLIAASFGKLVEKVDNLCGQVGYLVEREQGRAGVPLENP